MSFDDNLARRAEQRVGALLRGKYRLERVLGIGGMATVYAATHRNRAEFAVKILHPELSMQQDVRTRFLREGYVANSVKHVGAVRVVDDDISEDGEAFLVMELLEGATVEDLRERAGGTMPLDAAVAVIDQLLEVLAAAHSNGIVHRDIKPANLFVTRQGLVKVLDFGIARARDAAATGVQGGTGSGMLLGTPAFMSPEQALAKTSEVDAQTDVWAAGATLFMLVTGKMVHEGENAPQLLVRAATVPPRSLAAVDAHVPLPIVQVVDRALAFRKIDRWPSAVAMTDALRIAWRTVAGERPSRLSLEAFFRGGEGPTVSATTEAQPSPTNVQGGTTAEPVSRPPVDQRVPGVSGRRGAIIAAVALASTVLVAAALGWGIASRRATGSSTAPTATDAPTAVEAQRQEGPRQTLPPEPPPAVASAAPPPPFRDSPHAPPSTIRAAPNPHPPVKASAPPMAAPIVSVSAPPGSASARGPIPVQW